MNSEELSVWLPSSDARADVRSQLERRRAPSTAHEPTSRTGTRAAAACTSGVDRAAISRPAAALQRALRSRSSAATPSSTSSARVNTTLEPARDRRAGSSSAPPTGYPRRAGPWSSSDRTGQTVGARRRGLEPDIGPAVYAIAQLGDAHGEAFVDRRSRGTTPRVSTSAAARRRVSAHCRGRRVGALIGLDRDAVGARAAARRRRRSRRRACCSSRPRSRSTTRLLLKRAEALSVTDDLTHSTTRGI